MCIELMEKKNLATAHNTSSDIDCIMEASCTRLPHKCIPPVKHLSIQVTHFQWFVKVSRRATISNLQIQSEFYWTYFQYYHCGRLNLWCQFKLCLHCVYDLESIDCRNKPATNNAVAVLVEMYLTLFRDLPPYVADVNDVSHISVYSGWITG